MTKGALFKDNSYRTLSKSIFQLLKQTKMWTVFSEYLNCSTYCYWIFKLQTI